MAAAVAMTAPETVSSDLQIAGGEYEASRECRLTDTTPELLKFSDLPARLVW
jgi:hypothetical protein